MIKKYIQVQVYYSKSDSSSDILLDSRVCSPTIVTVDNHCWFSGCKNCKKNFRCFCLSLVLPGFAVGKSCNVELGLGELSNLM